MGGMDPARYPQRRKQPETIKDTNLGRTSTKEEVEVRSRTLHRTWRTKVDPPSPEVNPQLHHDTIRPTARRNPTRPNARWTDELHNFVKNILCLEQVLNEVCSNPDFWKNYEDQFVNEDVD